MKLNNILWNILALLVVGKVTKETRKQIRKAIMSVFTSLEK